MRRWDDDTPPDEIDRLFTRLRPASPPRDLAARVLRALPAEAPAAVAAPRPAVNRRVWQWVAAIAGVVLFLMSLRVGSLLEDSGALGVLGSAIGDSAFWSAPGDYLATLGDALPWLDLSVALAALVAFWVSSSALVSRPDAARRGR